LESKLKYLKPGVTSKAKVLKQILNNKGIRGISIELSPRVGVNLKDYRNIIRMHNLEVFQINLIQLPKFAPILEEVQKQCHLKKLILYDENLDSLGNLQEEKSQVVPQFKF